MATKKPKFSIIEPQRQASGNHVTLCTSKIPLHDSFNNIIGTADFYYNISEKQCNSLGRLLNDQLKETYTSFQNDKNYYITHGKETVRLTKRQAECLTYISMGKTVKEVSKILDSSPRTIEAHINDLRKKWERSVNPN